MKRNNCAYDSHLPNPKKMKENDEKFLYIKELESSKYTKKK